MAKKSELDRAIEKLDAEIEELVRRRSWLFDLRAARPKRDRKKAVAAETATASR